MRIKPKGEIYDMELKKLDFETRGVSHDGNSIVVMQITKAHTRAHE